MRKKVLMSLSVVGLLYSSTALAQTCTTTPNCETLGYSETEADCAGGKMLKCPFDLSKVFCDDSGNTGVDPSQAEPGMIYYSDGTISEDVISGKTPVGVVAYNDGDKRFVIALDEASKEWGGDMCLGSLSSAVLARLDYQGKARTQRLLSDTQSHPAAEFCNSYKPVTSSKGSSVWYLPAAGELSVVSFGYGTINNSLQKLSKTQISSGWYWSSTEHGSTSAWTVSPSSGDVYGTKNKNASGPVRCVLEF